MEKLLARSFSLIKAKDVAFKSVWTAVTLTLVDLFGGCTLNIIPRTCIFHCFESVDFCPAFFKVTFLFLYLQLAYVTYMLCVKFYFHRN